MWAFHACFAFCAGSFLPFVYENRVSFSWVQHSLTVCICRESLWHVAKQQSHVQSWKAIHRAASQREESELKNEQRERNNNNIHMPLRHFHHIFCVMGGFHLMACFSLSFLHFLFAFFFNPPLILSHLPLPAALLLDLTALVNLMSPPPARLITMRQTDLSTGKCESMQAKEEEEGG